jgi:tetratricopeptide (TPR) repeat protein
VAEDKAVLIKTAYSYYQKGDWDRAIEEYHKLADLDPKDLNVHNMLADIYAKKGDLPEALQQYDLVAQGFDEKNQIDKVLQVYKRMLKLVPGDPALSAAVQSLVEKYLVRARDIEETETSKAAEIYRSILRAEPSRLDATFQLARLLMKSGQKFEAIEALMNLAAVLDPETQTGRLSEVLQMVAEIDPVNVEARETLTQLLVKAGQTSLALRNLQSLIEIYISQNDYPKAEQSAQQALALGDQNTFYHLGVIYFNQQKYVESRQAFERFLQQQDSHVGALKYLALDYLRMNQNQEAVKVYQKILDVYFNENLLDEAREVRQTILELDPANQVVGQYALDQALVPPSEDTGYAAGVGAPAEGSPETDEADQQALLIEAHAYAEKGLYEQAIDVYLDMLKRWPHLAEIRVRLQQVYALMARSAEPAEKVPSPDEIKADLEQKFREQMKHELEEQARASRQIQDEMERKREIDQMKLRQELESKLMEQVQKTREEELRHKLSREYEEKEHTLSREKEQIEKERQQILEKMRAEMESSRVEMEKRIREQLEMEYREKSHKDVQERETQAQDAKEQEKRLVEAQSREREEQVKAQLKLEEEHRRHMEKQKKEQEVAKAKINQEIFQGMERIRQEKEKESKHSVSAPPPPPAPSVPAQPGKAAGGTSEAIDDPFIRKTLADIYAAQGLYVEALKIYERILSEEPENHEVKEKLRDILRLKGI